MHLAIFCVVGVLAIGGAQSYAVPDANVLKALVEKLKQQGVETKANTERESPMYYSDEYWDFYNNMRAIRDNIERLFNMTTRKIYDMPMCDFIFSGEINICSDAWIRDTAFSISEISSMQDVADLAAETAGHEISTDEAAYVLYIESILREPLFIIGYEFRNVYRQGARWARKTDFPYTFPLSDHTSVDEVLEIVESVENFFNDVDSLLFDIMPDYDGINMTSNATENEIEITKLLGYKSFMELYIESGLNEGMGPYMRPMVQEWLGLLQSKEMKSALFGLSRDIPEFFQLMYEYGIFELLETYELPEVWPEYY